MQTPEYSRKRFQSRITQSATLLNDDFASVLDDISYRAMMGEYILYYRGKIVGGIYDDRFLVKPTKAAVTMMPEADTELPYDGAKEMLLVDDVDNRDFLRELLDAMYEELPAPKRK